MFEQLAKYLSPEELANLSKQGLDPSIYILETKEKEKEETK